jgi:large conductance mechanosensitive channel
MSILKEFRDFAMKGNVVDLAVGVVIGAAFGKIVTSLVQDVITPPIGLLVGGVKFDHLKLVLKEAVGVKGQPGATDAITLNYGSFLQHIFDFMIIAAAIFVLVKIIGRLRAKMHREPPAAPPKPSDEVRLLTEIRDALTNRR